MGQYKFLKYKITPQIRKFCMSLTIVQIVLIYAYAICTNP